MTLSMWDQHNINFSINALYGLKFIYRQISYKEHQIWKLECLLPRFAIVFAQTIEAMC